MEKDEFNELFQTCEAIIELGHDIQQRVENEFQNKEFSEHQIVQLFFLVVASRNLGALLVLCKSGYSEQSLILLRAIFEIIVQSEYIALDPENRAHLFVNYVYVDLNKGLDYLEQKGLTENLDKNKLEWIEEIKRGYELVKSNYPKERHWTGENKTVEYMANKVGLTDEYETIYRTMSKIAHYSPTFFINYKPDKHVDFAVVCGCKYYLRNLYLTNEVFELGLKETITRFGPILDTL